MIPWAPGFAAVVLLGAGMAMSQTLPTAKALAAKMGAGWNLGNTMELIGVQPIPTKALFDSVKAAGFKTVRIPAAWDMHADHATNVIDPNWMAQVKQVVDYAIQDSLYVVLNIHWDGGWIEGKIDSAATRPAMLATMKAKQGAYWKQIGTTFRDYDEHLLFASANEPGVDNQANIGILLDLHQIFIDTVRAIGGNNASRTLILPGPSTSFEHTADWITKLPTDKIADRLMVEAHFYPYQFCLMSQPANWGSPFYYWGKAFHSTTDVAHNSTWGEEAYVDSQFNLMKPNYLDKNIPVLVGEFGAMKRLTVEGDNLRLAILSRRHFYNYVTKAAISRGMIPVAWDAGGKGDGTMTIFDRKKEGAIYDLGLLNAIRDGAGLAKLPGDTTSDYQVATGNNSLRILYSAKDSGRGQVSLAVAKGDVSGYDSIVVRAYVKGTTDYDSAGIKQYGFLSLSLVTMSKGWTWKERTLGQVTMDGWKNYSIPLSSNPADTNALVPADPKAIDFFALQAYSKGYRGAIYVDWIVFKSKNGTSDTVYNFDQKAPEEGNDNVESVSLFPTNGVEADLAWETATTSKWGSSVQVAPKIGNRALRTESIRGGIRAHWTSEVGGTAEVSLTDLQGRSVWTRSMPVTSGMNSLDIPVKLHGLTLLTIQQGSKRLSAKVF
ncbi:MAG: glycoside hydrolase family 5 protein [Fibrobacteria bacterium]|nr:glycoside hydrolase family 5 protein [Fibrobacteria bacterium]